MTDEITINLRALTESQIAIIAKELEESVDQMPDETNEEALAIINEFYEFNT